MRAYRWLLRLFPRAFRARFGRDMADLFDDNWRAARRRGPLAAAALAAATITDTIAHAAAERRRGRTPRIGPMFRRDLGQAFRSLARRRASSAAVIVTVALGVSATTSVFAVANALLFRPLPFADAGRLVRVMEAEDVNGFEGNVALGNLDDWCGIKAFEACGAYAMSDLNLAGGDVPDRVHAGVATRGFFDALAVRPVRGRLFSEDEIVRRAPVVLIAESAAGRLLGDADPIGKTLLLDGERHDVIGTLPDLPGIGDASVWRGMTTRGQSRMNHANHGVARLAAGASLEQARAELDAVSRSLQQRFPDTNAHWWARAQPLQDAMAEDFSASVMALGGLTLLLLLLCAVSAASLTAARAGERRRELAVRLALGANRRGLIAQLFTESLVLAGVGALGGVLGGLLLIGNVMAVLPGRLSVWRLPAADGWTLGFAAAAALSASLIFGLMPAVAVTRRIASGALDARTVTSPGGRLRWTLTALQSGLATVLLVAAALLGSVMLRVLTADVGFDPRGVLAFTVTAPRAAYPDAPALAAFFGAIGDRLGSLPGVTASGAVMNAPGSGSGVSRGVVRVGEPLPARGHVRLTLFQVSSPGYVRTIGLRLVDGRDFAASDTAASEPVALVNERLARELWPGQRAVGRQLLVHTDEKAPRTVVGVIADARQGRLDAPVSSEYYVPFAQSPRRTMTFVLRAGGPIDRRTLQAAVSTVDATIPVYGLSALDALLSRSAASRAAVASLSTFFGSASLFFSATGLFGLVASGVTERRREIGIRLALGASRSKILQMIAGRGLLATGLGVATGLVACWPTTRLLAALIGNATPSVVPAAAAVVATLAGAALAASWIPGRAALAVDPATSLRSE